MDQGRRPSEALLLVVERGGDNRSRLRAWGLDEGGTDRTTETQGRATWPKGQSRTGTKVPKLERKLKTIGPSPGLVGLGPWSFFPRLGRLCIP